MPNEILQDSNLSAESLGVLCSIMSYPPTFVISREWIINKFDLSDYKLRRILKELRELGVLDTKINKDKGTADIELQNDKRSTVMLKELVTEDKFVEKSKDPKTMPIPFNNRFLTSIYPFFIFD